MKLFKIVLYFILGFIILFFAFKNSNRNGYYDGFTANSYANCSDMTDCKTCADTLTSNDGVCYWCTGSGTGKCVSGKVYDSINDRTCHSDGGKCGRVPSPDPNPSPNPPGPDTVPSDPTNCPKLILLDTPSWITVQ